jgi:hypothetical protein
MMKVEYAAIRRPEHVADTKANPEVCVFVQTNTKHISMTLEELDEELHNHTGVQKCVTN